MKRSWLSFFQRILGQSVFLIVSSFVTVNAKEPSQSQGSKYIIGATIQRDSTGVIIKSVTEQSPAEKVGLEPGDKIIAIDGEGTEGMDFRKVMDLMTDDKASELVLTISRSNEIREYAVVRERIDKIFARIGYKIKDGMIVPLKEYPQPKIGQKAPDFDAVDVHGNKIRLADYKGRFVLLQFWGGYCVPCKDELPFIKAAAGRFYPQRLQIIGINCDEDSTKAEVYAREYGLDFVQIWEGSQYGEINKQYRIYRHGVPYNVLINPKGRIVEMALRGDTLVTALDKHLGNWQEGE